MDSDEPVIEQITHVPDKIWRVWAVSLGMAVILGRLLFIQEQHTTVLSDVVDVVQSLKTELESVETQTRTYQEGAREAMSDLRDRILRLEDQ